MISAVILTKNEEENIRECLDSLKWCDEIIVVDDHSTDKTIEIAKKFDTKIFTHRLNNDFAQQRNFGLKKAKGEWILFLDADERITPALRTEITNQLPITNFDGFYLKREDFFGGKALKYGETANVRLLRLGKRDKGLWKRKVHEVWELKGKIGELKNPILHYPHPTISDFLKHINFHSTLHAQALRNEGVKPSAIRIIINPLGKFFQNYILRRGFLDGMLGLITALMMSFHSFLARAKLYTFLRPPRRRSTSRPPSEVFGGVIPFLFFVYLVLFPFGQLTRIPLGFLNLPELNLYLTDVVLFLLVLSWGVWRIFFEKKKYRLPPLAKPIFLFALIGGASLIVNSPLFTNREVGVGFLYLLRWIFYAGLYFVIFDLKDRFNWLNWQNVKNFLIVLGVTVAIFGLVQYFLWPNLKALEVFEWDPHYYRVVGTFLDPGFTGIILVLALIIISVGDLRKNWGVWGVWGIIYLALALTYSRASWLAFFIALLLISYFKKSWKLLVVMFVLIGATWFLLPRPAGEGGKIERTYTIEARLTNYRQALIVAKDHPIFGVGFNTYRYAQLRYGFLEKEKWQVSHAGAGADSSLLFVLSTTGILGFLGYLGIWGKIIRMVKGVKKEKKVIISASIGALFVHSFFLNSLFYPWVMAWVWVLLAAMESN